MKVVISRLYSKNEVKGLLIVFQGVRIVYRCVTLELPDMFNVKNTSCIPEGTYRCMKYWLPAKGECFMIQNVPGRTNILIHKGNYTSDTKGCILVGNYFTDINSDGFIDIAESARTLKELYDIMDDEFDLVII